MVEQLSEASGQTPEIPQLKHEIVIFTGLEGSGKSTIAKHVAVATNKPYIYTGQILRDLAENDEGPWGDACRAMFNEHRYLEPELTLEIIKDRFGKNDTLDGFILDGGLRTIEETVGFQGMLADIDRLMPLTIVNLKVPVWESYRRLQGRGRTDDTYEGIMNRFNNYYLNLGQRATFMKRQDGFRFVQVDARGPIEDVFSRTCKALSS